MSMIINILKKPLIGICLVTYILLCVINTSYAQVHVRGYTRKDGTYVAPHYRSSPNSSKLDNWSTKGNINPYTGSVGTKNVYGTHNAGAQLSPNQINNLTTNQRNSLGIIPSQTSKPQIPTSQQQKSKSNNRTTVKPALSGKDYDKSVYQRAKKECEGILGAGTSFLADCIQRKMPEFKKMDQMELEFE